MANESVIERELEHLSIVIAAAEDWGKGYAKDPASHAKLIKLEAKLERKLRQYLRELARDRMVNYVNWTAYHIQVIQAYDINVIFDEGGFDAGEGELLLNVLHDPILDGYGVGLEAGQNINNRQLGLSQTDAAIQKAALEHTAKLVTGINQTSKAKISQSISSSMRLGEDYQAAAKRLSSIINDPKRALTIARTESVSSYNQGLTSFGKTSGAVGKVWDDVGATDECASNTEEGQIPFDDSFGSGDDAPPAHPNCRCSMQLIYDTGEEQTVDEEQ